MFDINGKCYKLIKNLYLNIKSCVTVNGERSMRFPCDIGVRQGENLSPLLFSIYLNDLEQFLSQSGNVNGVTCSCNNIEENAHILLKLFVMLYADDTVILAETADDLQNALTQYALYCETWKLNINNSKTKIVIFARGRLPDYRFRLIEEIEIVPNYKYLGVMFSRTGSFLATKRHIASQANRAVFCLLKKAKNLLLPIDIQIEMFLKTVKPILLYACEICGHGNVEILEQVQLKFLKSILNLKKSTPNCIVYGETGVLPLKIDIQTRIISFWSKIVLPVPNNLSSKLYAISLSHYQNHRNGTFKWLENVRSILISCGFSGIWDNHVFPKSKWLVKATHQKLTDLFLNEWKSQVDSNSSCYIYRLFKQKFGFEDYLIHAPAKFRKYLIKFRTRNHRLPIEIGRWLRTPRENRKCHLCNTDTGDEFHYLLVCKELNNLRRQYIDANFIRRPNIITFSSLLSTKNKGTLRKLCIFIKHILESLTFPPTNR